MQNYEEEFLNSANGGKKKSRNAGYIKLLLAKHLYKRGADDYLGGKEDKYRKGRQMAKNFNMSLMRKQVKPPNPFKSPSEFIERAYGKQQRKDKGQKRVKIANNPDQYAYLNKPFTAQQRKNLSPEELAIVRAKERERKNRSLANKRAKQEAVIGSGAMPPEKTFYDVAKEQYKSDPTPSLDGFDLVFNTPTIKGYLDRNAKSILIASRGTVGETGDISADAAIAYNGLKNTNRYNTDKNAITQIASQYPPDQYDYYITGHSLGGAIVAQLKRDFPFIKNAVVYNPASQPYDFISQQSDTIKRIYTADDPLYALGGTFMSNKQVIPTKRNTIKNSTLLPSAISLGAKGYNYYQGHALDNFNTLYGGYFHRKGDGTGSALNFGRYNDPTYNPPTTDMGMNRVRPVRPSIPDQRFFQQPIRGSSRSPFKDQKLPFEPNTKPPNWYSGGSFQSDAYNAIHQYDWVGDTLKQSNNAIHQFDWLGDAYKQLRKLFTGKGKGKGMFDGINNQVRNLVNDKPRLMKRGYNGGVVPPHMRTQVYHPSNTNAALRMLQNRSSGGYVPSDQEALQTLSSITNFFSKNVGNPIMNQYNKRMDEISRGIY